MWRFAIIPDVDKGNSLESVEYKLDPFCEAAKFEAVERFTKCKIPNQVESRPDVPFQQVDLIRARGLDSLT